MSFLSFLFFLFFFLSCSRSDDLCFEYTLQNECTSVLGTVLVDQEEQQDFFLENVSLTVSNVRMFGSDCRRQFLSYSCQLMFGGFVCESSSSEEQLCLEEQYCFQVSESCSDDFLLNCSSSSSSPAPTPSPLTSSCQEEVMTQIEKVVQLPIEVQTCLNNAKEDIECCIKPYVFDENNECVVECPQYLYGQDLEYWIGTSAFVFFWISFLVYIIAIIPFYMTENFRYPYNVLFIFYAFFLLAFTPYFWGIFGGGPAKFVCGSETNFWKAIDHFGKSTRSIIQYSSWVLFSTSSACLWSLFAFNFLCSSLRPFTSYFDKFIVQPVNPTLIRSLISFCVLFSVSIFLGFLLFAFLGNYDASKLLFTPSPVYAFPNPIDNIFFAFQYPFILFGAIGTLFFFIGIGFFLRRGRQILYFQWRAFFAGCFWLTTSSIFLLALLLPGPSASSIVDYSKCVASHPQISPTSCTQKHDSPDFFLYEDFLVVSLFMLLLLVAFMTNEQMVGWWKDLISKKCFSRYEQIPDQYSLN